MGQNRASVPAHAERHGPIAGIARTAGDLARERSRFTCAVLGDPTLTHFEARIGAYLCERYANADHFIATGQLEAWPSQKRMAEETGATEAGVRKATRGLASRGFIHIKRGGGRSVSTRYRLIIPAGAKLSASISRKSKGSFAVEGLAVEGFFVEAFAEKPSTGVAETLNHGAAKPSTATPPTLLKEIFEYSKGGVSTERAADAEGSGNGLRGRPPIIPRDLFDRVRQSTGGDPFKVCDSYLRWCLFDETARTLHPSSELARRAIEHDLRRQLKEFDLTLGAPIGGARR